MVRKIKKVFILLWYLFDSIISKLGEFLDWSFLRANEYSNNLVPAVRSKYHDITNPKLAVKMIHVEYK